MISWLIPEGAIHNEISLDVVPTVYGGTLEPSISICFIYNGREINFFIYIYI